MEKNVLFIQMMVLLKAVLDSYVVQSSKIKWKTKNSSDPRVITQSRSTLTELIKTTLDILLHQLHHAISVVLKILLDIERLIYNNREHST